MRSEDNRRVMRSGDDRRVRKQGSKDVSKWCEG